MSQTYPKIHSGTNVETIIPKTEEAEPPVITLSRACKALHKHFHRVGILKVPPHTCSVPLPIHHWASHIHPPWPFESANSLCLKHISHICFAPLIYNQISDAAAPSSEVTAHFVPFVSTIRFIIILDNHLGFFALSLDRKLYKYRDCTLFLVSAHCLAYSGHENSWRMMKKQHLLRVGYMSGTEPMYFTTIISFYTHHKIFLLFIAIFQMCKLQYGSIKCLDQLHGFTMLGLN